LRKEVERLRNGRRKKGAYLRRMQKDFQEP
jgi:hypothetical protein